MAFLRSLQIRGAHRGDPESRVRLGLDRSLPHLPGVLPCRVETCEVEGPLGLEVAVEERLRGTPPSPPLLGGQARLRGAHPTSATGSGRRSGSSSWCGRTSTNEMTAPASAITEATSSDVENPSTKREGSRKTSGPFSPPT